MLKARYKKAENVQGIVTSAIAAVIITHDDSFYLAETIASLQGRIPAFVFVNRLPFHAAAGDWQKAAQVAEAAGATVIVGDWRGEIEHRQAAGQHLLSLGYTHALLPDGDEIIEPKLLDTLLSIAEHDLADTVTIRWDTYWKDPQHVIRPREPFSPTYLANLKVATPIAGHQYRGGRHLHLDESYGIVHHLSWVGPEERIQRKLDSWAHAKEVLPGWRERVWQGWDRDRTLHDLHPTHPSAYGFAEKLGEVPEILRPALEKWKALTGHVEPEPLSPVAPFPSVSIVIPVYGGASDLDACLTSLKVLHAEGLLHEVLAIDDASPEGEREEVEAVAARHPFARLHKRETNGGFAAACNAGASLASGELLLFLNSDTIVPRAGFLRLVESLALGGPLTAASGPLSNHAGHGQGIEATYTSLDNLDAFAEEFASRDTDDTETDMLVGFCLLVRRDAFTRLGGFDTRFGRGLFEDNDLCYRLRREGYRLQLSCRAFVHHEGSKTLGKAVPNVSSLLASNQAVYLAKWKEDLASGYASHLSGMGHPGRIVFDPARRPEERVKAARQRAKEAGISLVMIVKNEERVLGDCLASAMPFFAETIVVDTGSTDKTVEIATAAGAKLFHFPWTESFAEARNESLRHATGRWIFWLDADDTLSLEAGEAIQQAALHAPPEAMAFVVPVQFVEEGGMPGGTRVDHVKLFRSHPDLSFEGRIHEQILPSLRQVFGESAIVARAPHAAVVLHSGYDTSPEGQARKRVRDATILALELAERPDHPFVLFNLGMTDHYGGQHESAIEWLDKCLSVSSSSESHVRKAYALKAVSQRERGDLDAALETLLTGLAAVGDDPELHFQAGFTFTQKASWRDARRHYERAIGGDLSGHFSSVDTAILGYKTLYNLGQVCLSAGDWPAARGYWERSLAEAPDFLPSLFALFDGALESGDFATSRAALQSILSREGPSESWSKMGARQAEKVGGEAAGDAFLHAALSSFPSALAPRLVLMRRLVESGREGEATGLLHELQAAGVAEAAFFLGVQANRRGAFPEALHWMERAAELNPGHGDTLAQVQSLKGALGLAPAFTESWFDPECQEALADCAKSVSSLSGGIVEIGCWEGRSTICLANAVNPEVVHAVDHWEGNGSEGADHVTLAALARRDVFGRFQENVARFSPGNVEVHKESSESFFSRWSGPLKLVHIDGSHDEASVRADIAAALELLVPGGVLCGHDADAPEVRRALDSLLPGFETRGSLGRFWSWTKPKASPDSP